MMSSRQCQCQRRVVGLCAKGQQIAGPRLDATNSPYDGPGKGKTTATLRFAKRPRGHSRQIDLAQQDRPSAPMYDRLDEALIDLLDAA